MKLPIYEYKCKKCGTIEEFFVVGSEQALIRCTNCGSADMEKVMSPAAFIVNPSNKGAGKTCCGRGERCETPPCSSEGGCKRDN